MATRAAPALRTPAAAAAGDLVRRQLTRTSRAFAPLARHGAGEPELHAARVQLRRLRALVRAFRRVLGPAAGRRVRRDLRDLARITGGTRDLDVFVAWLADEPAGPERTGWRRAARRERDRRLASEIGAVAEAWPAVRKRLRRRLRDVPPVDDTFGRVAAHAVRDAVAHVRRSLRRAERGDDADRLHALRIAAKRLRYLLELVAPDDPAAAEAAAWATSLQDAIGDVRDAELAADRLRRGRLAADALRERNGRRLRDARQRLARRLGDARGCRDGLRAASRAARRLAAAG